MLVCVYMNKVLLRLKRFLSVGSEREERLAEAEELLADILKQWNTTNMYYTCELHARLRKIFGEAEK